MTLNRLWLQDFIEFEEGSVLVGDNKSYKIIIIGTIMFHLHDGTQRVLKKVRFVPSLKCNLISLGELEKNEYVFDLKVRWEC